VWRTFSDLYDGACPAWCPDAARFEVGEVLWYNEVECNFDYLGPVTDLCSLEEQRWFESHLYHLSQDSGKPDLHYLREWPGRKLAGTTSCQIALEDDIKTGINMESGVQKAEILVEGAHEWRLVNGRRGKTSEVLTDNFKLRDLRTTVNKDSVLKAAFDTDKKLDLYFVTGNLLAQFFRLAPVNRSDASASSPYDENSGCLMRGEHGGDEYVVIGLWLWKVTLGPDLELLGWVKKDWGSSTGTPRKRNALQILAPESGLVSSRKSLPFRVIQPLPPQPLPSITQHRWEGPLGRSRRQTPMAGHEFTGGEVAEEKAGSGPSDHLLSSENPRPAAFADFPGIGNSIQVGRFLGKRESRSIGGVTQKAYEGGREKAYEEGREKAFAELRKLELEEGGSDRAKGGLVTAVATAFPITADRITARPPPALLKKTKIQLTVVTGMEGDAGMNGDANVSCPHQHLFLLGENCFALLAFFSRKVPFLQRAGCYKFQSFVKHGSTAIKGVTFS
jgi:hypothetical protein